MWIIQKEEDGKWKTVVTNIPDETTADEWLNAKSRNNDDKYKKVEVKKQN